MAHLFDIVGQDAAVSYLQRTLTGRRRPHAFIFAGPTGVGRRTTAEALAAPLLCDQPTAEPNSGRLVDLPDDAPLIRACGQCDDCRMTTVGSHPDLHRVYKELAAYHDDPDVRNRVMQNLGIPVIRQFLIAPANQAPARGRGKVFVVREADLMSTDAQNALLKTLEEPPPGVTIILLCRRSELLLPTTLSRCAMIRFGPLPREFVARTLADSGIGPAEAAFWASFTEGSLGQALRLSAEGMYAVKWDLVARLGALQTGGDEDLAERLVKLTDKLAESAIAASLKSGATLSKTLATRQATGALLEMIASVYRDALTVALDIDRPLGHGDQADAVEAVAQRLTPTQLADVVEQLSAFEQMLWRNVNPKLVWDNAVITCASAAPLHV